MATMSGRRLVVVSGVLLAGLALLAGWDLYRIRGDLQAGHRDLGELSLAAASEPGLTAVAQRAHDRLDAAAGRARSSLSLRLLARLPVADRQVEVLRHLTAVTASLGEDAVSAAVEVDRALGRAGRPQGRLSALDIADRELARLAGRVEAVDLGDDAGLVPPLRNAHTQLAADLVTAGRSLRDGSLRLAPIRDMLQGPSTFLLLAANNAEMAGGSGMALSAAVLTFYDGDLSLGE